MARVKLSTGSSGEYFFLPQRLGHDMRKTVPFYGGVMTQNINSQPFVVQFSKF
jgi:hypothetical protein